MKQIINYIVFGVMLVFCLTACEQNNVDSPVFEVSVDTSQVEQIIGDTIFCQQNEALKFNLTGNPDMIVFYSGQSGNEYKYRNRTSLDGTPYFSFHTLLRYGTVFDALHVYVSSTFPGITRVDSIDRANIADMSYWTEITDQCNLPVSKTSPANETNTPQIDLTDYKNKPFYMAFRFSQPQGNESTWTLSNLSLINVSDGVTNTIGAFSTIGFTAFDMIATENPYLSDGGTTDKTNKRWVLTTASAESISVGGSSGNTVTNDDWAISDNINLTQASPDLGVAIKAFDGTPVTTYTYSFTESRVYTVTFVGINSYGTQRSESIKNLIIKIID